MHQSSLASAHLHRPLYCTRTCTEWVACQNCWWEPIFSWVCWVELNHRDATLPHSTPCNPASTTPSPRDKPFQKSVHEKPSLSQLRFLLWPRLPVVNFAAGGVATPADAALMMQMGMDGVFVGSGIFKSGEPAKRARAVVQVNPALPFVAFPHFRCLQFMKCCPPPLPSGKHYLNIR